MTADRLTAALGLDEPYVPAEPLVFVALDVDEYNEDGARLDDSECNCDADSCDCPAAPSSIASAILHHIGSRS